MFCIKFYKRVVSISTIHHFLYRLTLLDSNNCFKYPRKGKSGKLPILSSKTGNSSKNRKTSLNLFKLHFGL
jgi:hypothetical protein